MDNRYDSVMDIINDLASIDEDLDWEYNKVNDDYYTWYLKENNIKIDMIKENNIWRIVTEEYNNSAYSKEEAFEIIKNIILFKKYKK